MKMKATEHYFPMVLFILVFDRSQITSLMQSYEKIILTKARFPSKTSNSFIASLESFASVPDKLVINDMYSHTSFKI